jgi:putative oxidoreductase
MEFINMIEKILETDNDYVVCFNRVVAGAIIFPYGQQKLFGWFNDFGGGVGVKESLNLFKQKNIHAIVGWLVILGQSLGSIALLAGVAGRVAAAGNIVIFTGALICHLPDGWVMNWTGKKRGEGIEYFVLLLTLLLVTLVKGSGAASVDHWLFGN